MWKVRGKKRNRINRKSKRNKRSSRINRKSRINKRSRILSRREGSRRSTRGNRNPCRQSRAKAVVRCAK